MTDNKSIAVQDQQRFPAVASVCAFTVVLLKQTPACVVKVTYGTGYNAHVTFCSRLHQGWYILRNAECGISCTYNLRKF